MCADFAHSRPKEPRHRDSYDFETALDKPVVRVNRIFARFTEAQQDYPRSALADRHGRRREDAPSPLAAVSNESSRAGSHILTTPGIPPIKPRISGAR